MTRQRNELVTHLTAARRDAGRLRSRARTQARPVARMAADVASWHIDRALDALAAADAQPDLRVVA